MALPRSMTKPFLSHLVCVLLLAFLGCAANASVPLSSVAPSAVTAASDPYPTAASEGAASGGRLGHSCTEGAAPASGSAFTSSAGGVAGQGLAAASPADARSTAAHGERAGVPPWGRTGLAVLCCWRI